MVCESQLIGWFDVRVVCFCQISAMEKGKVRMKSCLMLKQEMNLGTALQRMYRLLTRMIQQRVRYH